MADGLEGLPVATLICDPQGQILLANRKARDLFGGELRGDELRQCLAELGHPSLAGGARPTLETLEAIEFRDHRERDLRLDLARLLPVESETAIGWLVSLIDLSAERDAERQRATLLRFLSTTCARRTRRSSPCSTSAPPRTKPASRSTDRSSSRSVAPWA